MNTSFYLLFCFINLLQSNVENKPSLSDLSQIIGDLCENNINKNHCNTLRKLLLCVHNNYCGSLLSTCKWNFDLVIKEIMLNYKYSPSQINKEMDTFYNNLINLLNL